MFKNLSTLFVAVACVASVGIFSSSAQAQSGARGPAFSAPSFSSAPVQSFSAPVQSFSAPVQTFSAPVQTFSAPVQSFSAPIQTSQFSAPVQFAPARSRFSGGSIGVPVQSFRPGFSNPVRSFVVPRRGCASGNCRGY